MPIATLLLRETTSTSLTSIVERSQRRKPPLPEYDLQVNSSQLDLIPSSSLTTTIVPAPKSSPPTDEGFESDIDSLSIVSSDDSFNANAVDNGVPKKPTTETDSANGSACSDSDETDSTSTITAANLSQTLANESYNLVSCVCYADVKFPDLLVFVIKKEALVFKFANLDNLQKFHTNFNALKAVANQKAYGKNLGPTKFNLLHRTDVNGVTHIEISRQPPNKMVLPNSYEATNIISINTPDNYIDQRILNKMNVKLIVNEFKEHKAKDLENKATKTLSLQTLQKQKTCREVNRLNDASNGNGHYKSASTENIVEIKAAEGEVLRKVWNSAENLLDGPKKIERRRKQKGKAPPPPKAPPRAVDQTSNVVKGEYIRVSVPKIDAIDPTKSFGHLGVTVPKLTTYQQFKHSDLRKAAGPPEPTSTLMRNRLNLESWTSSVPRLLKSQRSRSETRNFTPMAYRYIDTTQSLNNSPSYSRRYAPPPPSVQISNRLFGMSPKLKDFSSAQKYENADGKSEGRWSSLGELSHKINNTDGSLKSVIKKEENKRKNEKKVTFSAYTTVQVV